MTYGPAHVHRLDAHCAEAGTVDEQGDCAGCGAVAGDRCPECGAVRYHADGCEGSLASLMSEQEAR